MEDIDVNKGPRFGGRHLQTLLLFLAITVSFSERLNVSVSLVAMTNAASTNIQFREFDWDEKERSYIISSFYWGYVLTQLPAGYLAARMGCKVMMLLSILCCTICTLITPLSVEWGGWQVYCLLRFAQGLAQGFLFPLVHDHLATWAPNQELTSLGGLSQTGVEFGSILAMCVTGYIAGSSLGWPGNFYVFGGIGLVFCFIWMVYAENSPSRSTSITLEEKEYILGSQAKASDSQTAKIPIPWRAIFTSVPFLTLIFVMMCQMWGSSTMQAYVPPYFHGVFKMDIKGNATFSTLSFVARWICANIYTFVADLVLRKNWASLEVVRKTANTMGMWIPPILLVVLGFLDESQTVLGLTVMVLNVGLNAGCVVGGWLNINDLSPNHAGILTGILNGIVYLSPVLSPLIIGRILTDETSRSQWQIVFALTALIFFVGNLLYLFLGSTDTQPWNDENFLRDEKSADEKRNKESYVNKCFE